MSVGIGVIGVGVGGVVATVVLVRMLVNLIVDDLEDGVPDVFLSLGPVGFLPVCNLPVLPQEHSFLVEIRRKLPHLFKLQFEQFTVNFGLYGWFLNHFDWSLLRFQSANCAYGHGSILQTFGYIALNV